ncbi:hypothetical protein AVEN_6015-1 [Araneus ventricosus]|uniref:Uncharacterized protein n=1 Tax=Araneus ventricosus TaxID=182803 RepID=A0A4Y2K4U3_ARAVE|nr:hypothetical protein AVEN_6015-1 [Araneus ventricosus]
MLKWRGPCRIILEIVSKLVQGAAKKRLGVIGFSYICRLGRNSAGKGRCTASSTKIFKEQPAEVVEEWEEGLQALNLFAMDEG